MRPESSGRAVVFVVVLLLLGVAAGAWYSRHQHAGTASSDKRQLQPARAAAVLTLNSPGATAVPAAPASPNEPQGKSNQVEISVRPSDQFREELKKSLAAQLAAAYPQFPDLNRETGNTVDASYRESVFQFVEAAEKAKGDKQAAMFVAADFMLQALWCPSGEKETCDPMRKQFADHKLTLALSELGGGWYYQHDLLWRVWQEFPTTDWGQRAFVLLLDLGWDTSGMCAKVGSDQFREVIRQGETFLEKHPDSPNRAYILHLVGQAYATWWSLSVQPGAGVADYVDPNLYHDGAEDARLKAIDLFGQVQQISPGTALGEYSREVLPALRSRQLTSDAYRFFCIYD